MKWIKMKSNFSVNTDIFKPKVHNACNPDIILKQNRLFLDIRGHRETAGMKWRGSLGPCVGLYLGDRIFDAGQIFYAGKEGESLSECQWGGRFVEEKANSWQEVTTLNHFISTSHYTSNLPLIPLPLLHCHCPQTSSLFPSSFSPLLSSPPHLLHLLPWSGKFRYH